MRRDVAASMIEHNFYSSRDQAPNLLQSTPIDIGIPQIDTYPVYYWLASLPLRELRAADITLQLYAARSVSLMLLLVSILGCWGIVQELTSHGNILRWLIPICLALLPAYVDSMTAVNNDAAAIAFSSLLIWGIVGLIQRGFSVVRLAGCVICSVLCFYSKTTTYPIIAMLGIAIALSLLNRAWRWIVWAVAGAGLIVLTIASIHWDDARGWLRLGSQADGVRYATPLSTTGRYAFRLAASSETGTQMQQGLSSDLVAILRGQTVVLSAMAWSTSTQSQPAITPILIVHAGPSQFNSFQDIQLSPQPTLFSFTATIPFHATRVQVSLAQSPQVTPNPVFYDDLKLALDKEDTNNNFLANPSAEEVTGRFDNRLNSRLAQENLLFDPNHILAVILDPNARQTYLGRVSNLALQTFGARFGWGHVPLENRAFYPLLNALIFAGTLCSAYVILTHPTGGKRHTDPNTLLVLVLMSLTCCIGALARATYVLYWGSWFPGARYIYPVVAPLLLMVLGGWVQLINNLQVPRLRYACLGLLVCVFAVLNVYSLISIIRFYAA
jgi:hypothetical protein